MADNNVNIGNGHISLLVSLLNTSLLYISWPALGEFVKIAAGIVSIFAGVMAIRYYYYATIKQKK